MGNREYFQDLQDFKYFLLLNHDVAILRYYPSGSDAVTLLVERDGKKYFRKFALGYPAKKLRDQYEWIVRYSDRIPLVPIAQMRDDGECFMYDMPYLDGSIGFQEYIPTHTVDESWAIYQGVFTDLKNGLYEKKGKRISKQVVEDYVLGKLRDNMTLAAENESVRNLMKYPTLIVNGKEYHNNDLLQDMMSLGNMRGIFASDRETAAHGDLTTENIIVCEEHPHAGSLPEGRPYYIIDPNPVNPINSEPMDFGKMLQSLHGNYEFIPKRTSLSVDGNHVDFEMPVSPHYRELYLRLRDWLFQELSPEDVRSAYYHELMHWWRLIPYRIRRDAGSAPCYYASFVMVMNDVWEMYEKY